jgi:hypothetical protein
LACLRRGARAGRDGREPRTCGVVRRWRARSWKDPPRPPRADRVAEVITGGTGSGTEAREAATERAVLRMVALGVPAAQAARFGYCGGWLGRLLSAFAE